MGDYLLASISSQYVTKPTRSSKPCFASLCSC